MKRYRLMKWTLLVLPIAVFVILTSSNAQAANGTLAIGAPRGPGNQDPNNSQRLVVTYQVTGGGVPEAAITAANEAIEAWIDEINGREAGWDFDIVPFNGNPGLPSGGFAERGIFACHKGESDPKGCDGDSGGSDGKADIDIKIKKGGGVIAGMAQSSFDDNGYRMGLRMQVSGSSFGWANDTAKVKGITLHELGHAFSLGHHSNGEET